METRVFFIARQRNGRKIFLSKIFQGFDKFYDDDGNVYTFL